MKNFTLKDIIKLLDSNIPIKCYRRCIADILYEDDDTNTGYLIERANFFHNYENSVVLYISAGLSSYDALPCIEIYIK